MNVAETIVEHQFESTHEALEYAYYCEAMRESHGGIDLIATEKKFRPRWDERTKYMTKQEIITDGIMIKNSALRAIDKRLSSPYRWAVGVKHRNRMYRVNLEGRVVQDMTYNYLLDSELISMAKHIALSNPRIKSKKYVVYELKRFVGDKLKKWEEEEDWSKETGRKSRTLRYWRNAENGILEQFNRLYERAYVTASSEFILSGIIAG